MCNSDISNGGGDLLENAQVFRGKCEGSGNAPSIVKDFDGQLFLKFFTSKASKKDPKTRTELAITDKWYKYEEPVFISFRVRIPENASITNDFFYLMQFWQPGGGAPLAGVRVKRGTERSINFMTRGDERARSMATFDLAINEWKYFVIKSVVNPLGEGGEFTVWDEPGLPVNSYFGRFGYSNPELPKKSKLRKRFRVKFGIYKGVEINKQFEVHFDDLIIADSFEKVNPWNN